MVAEAEVEAVEAAAGPLGVAEVEQAQDAEQPVAAPEVRTLRQIHPRRRWTCQWIPMP